MAIFKPYFQHYERMPFIFGKNIDYIFLKKTSMYLIRNGLKINFIHEVFEKWKEHLWGRSA